MFYFHLMQFPLILFTNMDYINNKRKTKTMSFIANVKENIYVTSLLLKYVKFKNLSSMLTEDCHKKIIE